MKTKQSTKPAAPDSVRLLTIADACEMLSVSRSTFTRLVRAEKIVAVSVSRNPRFYYSDILEFIASKEETKEQRAKFAESVKRNFFGKGSEEKVTAAEMGF